jgi:hypothetical protein
MRQGKAGGIFAAATDPSAALRAFWEQLAHSAPSRAAAAEARRVVTAPLIAPLADAAGKNRLVAEALAGGEIVAAAEAMGEQLWPLFARAADAFVRTPPPDMLITALGSGDAALSRRMLAEWDGAAAWQQPGGKLAPADPT